MKVLEESKPTNQDNPEVRACSLSFISVCLFFLSPLEAVGKNLPGVFQDCVKAFSKYVALLRQKFSASLGPLDKMLPDTKQQLFAR